MAADADTAASLFGREGELEQIDAMMAGDAGTRAYAYVEGHAGIGKTRLLDAARRRAEDLGRRVLTARGDDLESAFSYGVVRQLFEATLLGADDDTRAALLDGPAAHAATAIGVGPGAAADPDSAFPVLHGLAWLTTNLARRTPLVLILDDAHWADAPSLRYLDYLLGRIEDAPVAVVVAARPAEPGARVDLLGRLRDHHRPRLIRPRPLDEDATNALLHERFAAAPDAVFAAACRRTSGGNPFLLHELADALIADRVAPTRPAAELVEGLGPDTVARSLFLRLARLPPKAGEIVDAVAVFGAAAEVRHIAQAAQTTPDDVAGLADQLADAHVLAPGRPLAFVHPMVREAISREMRPAARARLHALAAEALLADGHPPGQAAPHLLATEPAADARTVAVLREAAAAALAQGAPDEARTYLTRALLEPPAGDARAAVLADLGLAELLGGVEVEAASAHLDAAVAQTLDPELRAARAHLAARARLFRGDLTGAVDVLEDVRTTVGPDAALAITAHQAAIGLLAPPCAADAIARLEAHADAPGETPAQLMAIAELAGSRWLDGRIAEAAAFGERAIAGGRLLAADGPASTALNHALRILIDADRYDLALPALAPAIAAAREQGSVLGLANLLCLRAVAASRRGDVLGAQDEARSMLEAAAAARFPISFPAHSAYLALALVERGELGEAEAAIVQTGCGPDLPALTYMGIVWLARARLRLAQDRPEEAWADLAELRRRDARTGVRHLSIQWHDTAVRAALALGDPDGARTVADEQLERASRWSIPSARGVALATKGLAIGGTDGIALFEAGVALLARSPARLDHARAQVDLGIMLGRTGRRTDAREALRDGLDGAQRCGAAALVHRAHDELTIAGARPRKLRFSGAEALTASERRVAQMAADGRTNREIAAALFVTVRTVENHLAHAYRKLGIGSRRDLPSALG